MNNDKNALLLNHFLAGNAELETLSTKLREFNLFRVLGIERAEIRHSNMLAWLLNAYESHGLGDRFLRGFLSQLLVDLDRRPQDLKIQASSIEMADFSGLEVYREWGRIDLMIRVPSVKLLVVIENKVGASESSGQLARYFEKAHAAFTDHEILAVYLTIQGDSPSEAATLLGYVPASHSKVLEVLERAVRNSRANIPESAMVLIDNYLTTLRRLTMNDQELVSLCKQIYKKHREAIELIMEHAASNNVLEACSEVVNEICRPAYCETDANRTWFLPQEWSKYTVERTSGWSLPKPYAVLWWFLYSRDSGRLQLSLEVGPMDDSKLRQRIVKQAESEGFEFSRSAFKEDSKYTRILTVGRRLQMDESDGEQNSSEEVKKIARALWAEAWPQGKRMSSILEKCLS